MEFMRGLFMGEKNGLKSSAIKRWVRYPFMQALLHPFGLAILCMSMTLAGVMRFAPIMRDGADLMLVLGILSYVTAAIVVHRKPLEFRQPELDNLYNIRDYMKEKLEGGIAVELTPILYRAIQQLEKEVMPALRELLEKYKDNKDLLYRYENGILPRPEPDTLARLRSNIARQEAAIDQCVKEASSAAVTFMEIVHEDNGVDVAIKSRALADLYDILKDVVSGVMNGDEPSGGDTSPPLEPVIPEPGRVHGPVVCLEDEDSSWEQFRGNVEEALRQLNNPAALSECELVSQIPKTLANVCVYDDNPTALQLAQCLREVIVSSIELLKPANTDSRPGSEEVLQYDILHNQYVLNMPTRHIMARLYIGDTKFFRNRREAVKVVARHLMEQEEQMPEKPCDANAMSLAI